MHLTRTIFLLLIFCFNLDLRASQEPLRKSAVILIPNIAAFQESEANSIEDSGSILNTVTNSTETTPKSGSPSRRDCEEGVLEIAAALKKASQETLSARFKKNNIPASRTRFHREIESKLMELASMLQQVAEDEVVREFSKKHLKQMRRTIDISNHAMNLEELLYCYYP